MASLSVTVGTINLPNGQLIVYDTQSSVGRVFNSAQDAISFFTVPNNSDAARLIAMQLLVAQNNVDGNPPAAVVGKTITLTFTAAQNPTISITPTP